MYQLIYQEDSHRRFIPALIHEPMKRHMRKHQVFMSRYHQIEIETDARVGRKALKSKNNRSCNICGKKSSNALFLDSKIIPPAVGNRRLISDSECESCYERLSIYDTDLINYITTEFKLVHGIKRSEFFKSEFHDSGPEEGNMRHRSEKLIPIETLKAEDGNHYFVSDFIEQGVRNTYISSEKHPYVPFNIYKSLLRISLLLMNDQDANSCTAGRAILNDEFAVAELPMQLMDVYTWKYPMEFGFPILVLYKKNNPQDLCFTYVLNVVIRGVGFQVAVPANESELLGKYQNKLILPPLYRDCYSSQYGSPKLTTVHGHSIIPVVSKPVVMKLSRLKK